MSKPSTVSVPSASASEPTASPELPDFLLLTQVPEPEDLPLQVLLLTMEMASLRRQLAEHGIMPPVMGLDFGGPGNGGGDGTGTAGKPGGG